ncbi:DUF6352 family protein [Bradyrhizobium sp. RDT10]
MLEVIEAEQHRPERRAPVAADGHAATAEGVRRDGRHGRRKRLDLLVAFGRARDGDESGGNAKARAGLCRVIERWISHLLGVTVSVETIASIEDRDWRWFIGLDSEATRIGNALRLASGWTAAWPNVSWL